MSLGKSTIRLAAIAIIGAWSISDAAFAQRGGDGGRGSGGGGGGRSASGGGGGGGRSFSGGGGGGSNRSFSSGGNSSRSSGSSNRSSSNATSRSGDSSRVARSLDGSSRDSGSRDSGSRDGATRQQSFFRGPTDSDRDNRGDRDNDRGDRGDRADRGDRDNNRNSGDWRNQVFGDNNRDRDNDRRDRNNLRGDNERGRDRDRDRNDWLGLNNRVRNDWNRWDRNNLPFRYGWWGGYWGNNWPVFAPYGYSRWANRPYYWWGWTPAGRLTSWLVFGWDRPRYWDYGYGNNIWYDDGYVYYDGDRYLPVNDYYQQVYDLAHNVPKISKEQAENMDWAPLGVFAASRSAQDTEAGQRTLQLAVNKEGVISGTYFNAQSKQVHPLMGMVDERSKRAAFVFADGHQPKTVFETSIFNLTKDESTMMVHNGPNEQDTEIWHLLRLQQPEGSQQASAEPASTSLP